jgi:hypothetical protein
VVAALAVAACGSGDDLPVVPQQTAKQQVERYAGVTLAASGAAAFTESAANVTGCPKENGRPADPDERYYIQGIYRMPAGADTAARVRDEWQRDGYTMASQGVGVEATTPDDFRLGLDGGRLLIESPCYRPG